MDLIKLIPQERLQVGHFEMILALFKSNRRNKKFFDGRKPNYEDMQIITERIEWAVKNEKELDP